MSSGRGQFDHLQEVTFKIKFKAHAFVLIIILRMLFMKMISSLIDWLIYEETLNNSRD